MFQGPPPARSHSGGERRDTRLSTKEPPDPKAEGRIRRTAAILRKWLDHGDPALGVEPFDPGTDDDPSKPVASQ
jgi:hypothetical protein